MARSKARRIRSAFCLAVVCASSATVAEDDRAALPTSFRCSGNEPFWNLKVEGSAATYTALGESTRSLQGELRHIADSTLVVYRGRDEAGRELVAFVWKQTCVDTMADAEEGGGEMPFASGISLPGGDVRIGCCRPLSPAPPVASSSEGAASDRR